VEGYELKALRGAEKTITQHSPVIVLELKRLGERYGDSDSDTIAWLAARGYRIAAHAHRDVIFTRSTHEH
jgi:Methyltransferase FkbM domain